MSQVEQFTYAEAATQQTRKSSSEKNPGPTSEEELEQRIELTYRLLSDGLRKSDIKQALKDSYGVCARTAEAYLSRARELQLIELREERDIHRAGALALYRRMLADPTATIKDKLLAQQQIDKLLGLAVPMRVAMQIRETDEAPRRDDFELALEHATIEQLSSMRLMYERAYEDREKANQLRPNPEEAG